MIARLSIKTVAPSAAKRVWGKNLDLNCGAQGIVMASRVYDHSGAGGFALGGFSPTMAINRYSFLICNDIAGLLRDCEKDVWPSSTL